MLKILGLTGLLLCWPCLVLAELTEHLDYSYYEVDGSPADTSLHERLNNASPVRHEGKLYHARTDWNIDWRFNWETTENNRCAISDVRTTLDAIILLPSIKTEDAELQQAFNDYLRLLQVHEQGHYLIGVQAANAIMFQVGRLTGPCDRIEEQANELAMVILDEYIAREKLYDKVTRHGLEQDAWQEW